MNNVGPSLTAEDHSYRHAAEAYFEGKSRLAKAAFDSELQRVFTSFEEHWRHYFAPTEPERLQEAVDIMEAAGSVRFARDYAAGLILEAKADLEGSIPPSDARDLLASMADFFVKRDS